MYKLPKVLSGNAICRNGDYRVVLSAISAFSDSDLNPKGILGDERLLLALQIFYEDFSKIQNIQKAIEDMFWFMDCGMPQSVNNSPIYSWQKDMLLIAGAVSHTAGFSVLEIEYLHWWSFIAYFNQIGEGAFATVCGIREKKRKGKKLEKWEQEFERNNSHLISLSKPFTTEEKETIDNIYGGE